MAAVPEFPQFGEVTLDLREPIAPLLRRLRPGIAEFTFSNLFLFRKAHAYRVSRLQGLLLVTGQGYGGEAYAYPPLGAGDVEGAAFRVCEHLAARGAAPVLFPVPEDWVAAHFGAGWSSRPDRDQADYVYSREELARLPGRKFHKRRNRLAKFLAGSGGAYAYEELRAEHVPQCLELARGWCAIRCSTEKPATYLETEAALEALRHREDLGLSGGVIRAGGRVVAFCLGEELNPETFVVHFEKSDPGSEGLPQLMNREFCAQGLGRYRYVNREQDLGDPGLRRAKEGYHPVFLAAKYRMTPS